MLPAPVVHALLAPRQGGVRRGIEHVLRTDLGRPVEQALVLGAAGWRADVDLVVVRRPADEDVDGLRGLVNKERAHHRRECGHLGVIEARGRIRRRHAPLGDHRGRDPMARQADGRDQCAIGREIAPCGIPVHVRCVADVQVGRVSRHVQERVLCHHEQPVRIREAQRDAVVSRLEYWPRAAGYEVAARLFLEMRRNDRDVAHVEARVACRGHEQSLAHEMPLRPQLVLEREIVASGVPVIADDSASCLAPGHRQRGTGEDRVVERDREAVREAEGASPGDIGDACQAVRSKRRTNVAVHQRLRARPARADSDERQPKGAPGQP